MSTLDPDPREEKLPRWAQVLLCELRREVASAKATAQAARLATDPEGSDMVLDPYKNRIGLGKSPLIHVPGRNRMRGGVIGVAVPFGYEAEHYAGGEGAPVLDLRSDYGTLILRPIASNRVFLTVTP